MYLSHLLLGFCLFFAIAASLSYMQCILEIIVIPSILVAFVCQDVQDTKQISVRAKLLSHTELAIDTKTMRFNYAYYLQWILNNNYH